MSDFSTRVCEICGQMPEIRTFLPSEAVNNDILVGMEVELENHNGSNPNLQYWRCDNDGSLRDAGVEFILRQPLTGHDLEKSVYELSDYLKDKGYVSSTRCSTHIHIDMRGSTMYEVRLLTFIYAMFEKFLFKYVGGDREHNFYCVPLYNSLTNRRLVAMTLNNFEFKRSPKYSALNLKPLTTFGSIEFRMQQALQDPGPLLKWIRIIQKIKRYAVMNFKEDLNSILKNYSENGAYNLFCDVFQEISNELIQLVPEDDRAEAFKECMRSAQDMLVMGQPVNRNKLIRFFDQDTSWDAPVVNHSEIKISSKSNILDQFLAGEL